MKKSLGTLHVAAMVCTVAAVLGGCCGCPVRVEAPAVRTEEPAPVPEDPRLAHLVAFKAVLLGRNTTPPSNSEGRGELVAVYDRSSNLFRWRLSFSDLSSPVYGAHFHLSPRGNRTGAAVLTAGGRNIASPHEGRAKLTAAQRNGLLAGRWYVNLRSKRYPNGELRGQLVEQR
ncbi:MAG: CHRD domain-containing protein [Burkholderiaceae bacterium]|jgi:hypothetical protein|nr:CHRD domain-containing protein [Burkholderiaceae bacterium]